MGGKGMMQTLGIEISEIGDDYMKATMPASPAVHNPLGIVHGANVALAETIASYARKFCGGFLSSTIVSVKKLTLTTYGFP